MATTTISAGQDSVSAVLLSGDLENVLSGGKTSATTVSSGGIEYVSSGGTSISTNVSSYGEEVISSGGTALLTTVSSAFLVVAGGTTSSLASDKPAAERGSLDVAQRQPNRQSNSIRPAQLVCISRDVNPVCAQLGWPWEASKMATGAGSITVKSRAGLIHPSCETQRLSWPGPAS